MRVPNPAVYAFIGAVLSGLLALGLHAEFPAMSMFMQAAAATFTGFLIGVGSGLMLHRRLKAVKRYYDVVAAVDGGEPALAFAQEAPESITDALVLILKTIRAVRK